jgi:hypothetical protein
MGSGPMGIQQPPTVATLAGLCLGVSVDSLTHTPSRNCDAE